jgi:TrmH family RNA methyltransferase
MTGIRFVLVRPEHGGNIGAAARALKNMGQHELWLVEPGEFDAARAIWLAHGAGDVLDGARHAATLAGAVGDCRWVVAATRRGGRRRSVEWTPRTLAAAVHATPERRPLALVFGPEADGLSAQDLLACHDAVRIPSALDQPSLNLAQAVLVVAYELFVAGTAARAAADADAGAPAADEIEAPVDELAALYAHVESMLVAVGFARPETAAARMVALRRLLGRARLRHGEVRLLRGICRQAEWAARHDRPV